MFRTLSSREEALGKQIVDVAFSIHKFLGPGLLESVYEKCFCHELYNRNIPFKRQTEVAIVYNNLKIDDGLRLDILVDDFSDNRIKSAGKFSPCVGGSNVKLFKAFPKTTWFLNKLSCSLNKRRN